MELKYKTGGQSTIIKKFKIEELESVKQLYEEMKKDKEKYGWTKICAE